MRMQSVRQSVAPPPTKLCCKSSGRGEIIYFINVRVYLYQHMLQRWRRRARVRIYFHYIFQVYNDRACFRRCSTGQKKERISSSFHSFSRLGGRTNGQETTVCVLLLLLLWLLFLLLVCELELYRSVCLSVCPRQDVSTYVLGVESSKSL